MGGSASPTSLQVHKRCVGRARSHSRIPPCNVWDPPSPDPLYCRRPAVREPLRHRRLRRPESELLQSSGASCAAPFHSEFRASRVGDRPLGISILEPEFRPLYILISLRFRAALPVAGSATVSA